MYMNKKNNSRLIIFILIATVVTLGTTLLAVVLNPQSKSMGDDVAKLSASSYHYDFGTISMADGLAKHTFTIKNEGTANLKLSKISTSCMCTTVILDIDGVKSPKFGMAGHGTNPVFWSEELAPGHTANLEVIFDPLAHGPDAVGPITRTVTMYSNDGGRSNTRQTFTLTGNVIK